MNNFSTKPARAILDRLGSPDKKLKIIHIAGTNGKGSTAQFFTDILINWGKRTGTFTSPEVYSFNDQFRIDGIPLSDKSIEKYFGEAKSAAQGINCSDFEIQTAGIIYAFAQEGCEWAVIECGMGGLNDATNAISQKMLAVITSVSLEHTQYLGNTITEICKQKAGIIKNCPAVVNAYQTQEGLEYFKKTGAIITDIPQILSQTQFIYKGKEFVLSAQGKLQAYNASTAIEGARLLKIPEKAIYSGIKSSMPEGRLQRFEAGGVTYILDGAHNPAAFEPLGGVLAQEQIGRTTVIFGCLSDKDIDGNLKALEGHCGKIIAVQCPGPRARSLEQTVQACKKYFNNVLSAQGIGQALDMADTQIVVVCGSFTLLTEAKHWIENLTGKKQ